MEKLKELYEKHIELEKEKLEIRAKIEKFEKKKKELENKLKDGKETSQYISKSKNIETMG